MEPISNRAPDNEIIFSDISTVNQLAADWNAKLDNKIVADEKYIPALKKVSQTSSEQTRIANELNQLRIDKDKNFKLRENLNRLDYYLRNTRTVESQRDKLIREGKSREEINSFEEKNIPAEARGRIILPPEEERNDIEKAYGEKVDAWIDAATAAQDQARAEIAEENMPESEKRARDLERRLAQVEKERDQALAEAARQRARAEAAEENSQRLRNEAVKLKIEEEQLATPPPSGERQAGQAAYADEQTNQEVINKIYGSTEEEIAQNPSLARNPENLRPSHSERLRGRFRTWLHDFFADPYRWTGRFAGAATVQTVELVSRSINPTYGLEMPYLMAYMTGLTGGAMGVAFERIFKGVDERFRKVGFGFAEGALGMAAADALMSGLLSAGIPPMAIEQTPEKVAQYVEPKDVYYTVKKGDTLSQITQNQLHLGRDDTYEKLVPEIKNNAGVLKDYALAHGHPEIYEAIKKVEGFTNQSVLKSKEAWKTVMTAGKLIAPGMKLVLKP